MVNVVEFAKRLNIIMDFYQLSAALLADKIEVQRSSISHLLSGRNKPSLEFPEVELYWLLNGVGTFPKTTTTKSNQDTPTLFSNEKKNTIEEKSPIKTIEENSKEIERIIIFFKDGSFKNYNS